jgi:uncharacterized SAM-binding protein YcdF (DUF218 family)
MARKIVRSEERLFREADLVFVTSEKLRERAAKFRDKVYLFPFGVDFIRFEQARNGSGGLPEDLRVLPRPVVGYVGGLHKWVDQELLVKVTRQMPEVSFAFVGPLQADTTRLASCPNVHLLGARSHSEIALYIKGFDVGIVPYSLSEYTTHVYPTKLNEYLAMDVPVVATDLPEIRRFNLQHGEVVKVGGDADEFVEAVRSALKASPAEEQRRIEVARQNSWEQRIHQMSKLIEEKFAERGDLWQEGWEKTLRRLYRDARRRISLATVGILAAYLLVFYTPLIWLVAEPLRVSEPPQPADAIVVFAGGVGESGKAGGGYQERVKQAVDLYHARQAPRMIFSSGFVFAFSESEIMKSLAVSLGVPAKAITLENKAANTYENVVFVNEILHRNGWRTILLVSSPYHMRRALWTFKKVAPEIRAISTPVPQSQFYQHDWRSTLEHIGGIMHEYLAIAYYWWKGWI